MREEEILRPVSAREFESEFRFSPGFRVRPVSAFTESQSTTSSSLSSSQKKKVVLGDALAALRHRHRATPLLFAPTRFRLSGS
jgi:hypothetical protein